MSDNDASFLYSMASSRQSQVSTSYNLSRKGEATPQTTLHTYCTAHMAHPNLRTNEQVISSHPISTYDGKTVVRVIGHYRGECCAGPMNRYEATRTESPMISIRFTR